MTSPETSSAEPNQRRPRWFIVGVILLMLGIFANALAAWKYSADQHRISAPLAELIGNQLADSAAPLVLSNNQLALQALAQKATRHEAVAHVAFYDLSNQLLAQAGLSRMANQGLQIREEISLQDRLLGYTRVALESPQLGLFNNGLLNMGGAVCSLLGLMLLIRSTRPRPHLEDSLSERPKSSLMEKQAIEESYQQLPESEGEYGIIAVELLQLPLMRKQLSEDTLYEYLTTFEHWLEQVAALYGAAIRVGETGFTLSLFADATDTEEQEANSKQALVARTTYCAHTLMQALKAANRQRSLRSEPVFEARIGAHIGAPLQSEARLLRELYAQDAHRQAWQACSGKAADTVSLSHSIVAHPECDELQVGEQDTNGFYELHNLDAAILADIEQKVQAISNTMNGESLKS